MSEIYTIPDDVINKFISSDDFPFLKDFLFSKKIVVCDRDNHVVISKESEERFIEIEKKWNIENPDYDFMLLCIKTLS